MANHCIEVTCSDCGTEWCLRGCSDQGEPNPQAAQEIQNKIKEGKKVYPMENPRCPHCGGIGYL